MSLTLQWIRPEPPIQVQWLLLPDKVALGPDLETFPVLAAVLGTPGPPGPPGAPGDAPEIIDGGFF